MKGFEKIANRIGYPGLAILCVLAAAASGCWLLIGIIVQDQKKRQSSVK